MSEKNVIKIVVDTNIWISFLIGRSFDSLVSAITDKSVEIFFSRELYDELFTVITRPKLKEQIKETKIAEIREIVSSKVTIIEPACRISDCRDPGDNFLLELAVSAKADYLITGDDDLLVLNPYHDIQIIKAKEFENILRKIYSRKRES